MNKARDFGYNNYVGTLSMKKTPSEADQYNVHALQLATGGLRFDSRRFYEHGFRNSKMV